MKLISVAYHDVVDKDYFTGFTGIEALRYKIEINEFRSHMMEIKKMLNSSPICIFDFLKESTTKLPFLLTFDDGGVSAIDIAEILESFGFKGHFFITTYYIDKPNFLTKNQIRVLRKRGHIIGTHSSSHPERMSYCSWKELIKEWGESRRILSDILEEEVFIASLPGGYYSKKVAEAASFVGIKVLFTSEPTIKGYYVDKCLVLGRYTVYKGMSAKDVMEIISGKLSFRLQQFIFWELKKLAKFIGGDFYFKIRKYFLNWYG